MMLERNASHGDRGYTRESLRSLELCYFQNLNWVQFKAQRPRGWEAPSLRRHGTCRGRSWGHAGARRHSGRCWQVLGPRRPWPWLSVRRPPSWDLTRQADPHPRSTRRDLRPRAAPYLPVPQRPDLPEAWAYLSPACRQYATMMSREGVRRAESRRPVNVGSGRDPAAGRSGPRSGRGGAPSLPVPPPPVPPRPPGRPHCLVAECSQRREPIGERDRCCGWQRRCAPRASVVALAGLEGRRDCVAPGARDSEPRRGRCYGLATPTPPLNPPLTTRQHDRPALS